MPACWFTAPIMLFLCAGFAAPLHGQSGDSSRARSNTARHALLTAGLLAVGVVAMQPFDASIARSLQASSAAHPPADAVAQTTSTIGGLGAPLLSGGLLVAGAITGHSQLADAGWHSAVSLVAATGITVALKHLVGRARPATATWSDPGEQGPDSDEFRPVSRSDAWASFPSGHTTAAFATAASLTAELARHDRGAARIAGPLLYGGAGLVGLSRMYDNQHWASDVLAGAIIGIVVGRQVVARAHRESTTLTDDLLPSAAGVSGHRAFVAWSVTFP